MPAILGPRELAKRALRRVGVYAPHDSGVDADYLNVALECLDVMIGELTGTMRALWLVSDTVVFDLDLGENPVDLLGQATSAVIETGSFNFLVDIKLRQTNGTDTDDYNLIRLDRSEYEAIQDKATTGFPTHVYVDRTHLVPQAFFWPVPSTDDFQLVLAFQRYHPDVSAGRNDMEIDQAWYRYIEYALAADIGTGPIVHLNEARTNGYRQVAADARGRLEAFQNRETKRPHITRFRDF